MLLKTAIKAIESMFFMWGALFPVWSLQQWDPVNAQSFKGQLVT